jgi:hypothetical protein
VHPGIEIVVGFRTPEAAVRLIIPALEFLMKITLPKAVESGVRVIE